MQFQRIVKISGGRDKSFAKSTLPYLSSCITLQVGSSDHEYKVSKGYLCRESTYFSAMFNGNFREGEQQTATLEEIEGVVSIQSVEAFLLWLYTRKIEFDLTESEDQISAAIELARFADMCNVKRMEPGIINYLRESLINNPKIVTQKEKIFKTYCLTSQHIVSATSLPQGHGIRRLLAAAAVPEYLLFENHRFAQETREYPTFGSDVLQEVGLALKGMNMGTGGRPYEDPVSGEEARIWEFHSE